MANTTTGIPVFYFRPDPSPGTPAGDNDPAYELGNIQNISTTLNPEAVEIIRSHGDAPRATGMPQVSQSVNYEITISELGILPFLIITGAGGHNIGNTSIVTENLRSSHAKGGSAEMTLNFQPTRPNGARQYDPQRWYKLPHFAVDGELTVSSSGPINGHTETPSNLSSSNRTQEDGTNGPDYFVNDTLGLIRFNFRDDDGYMANPGVTLTIDYALKAIAQNSDYRMAQWMVSRYRTTYGRGDLFVYDDEGVVVWGHTQFRCTVWCSGDITFNPTEIATATITVAVETDSEGRTGFQFGDTSRLPF